MTPERRREIKAKYRENNREKLRTKGRQYQRSRSKAQKNAIAARCREANREKINERERQRNKANPENSRAACAKWRLANLERERERKRQYTIDHPERNRARARRRRARLMEAVGSHTEQEIQLLLEKQLGICADCRRKFTKLLPPTLDHVTPLSRGGSDSIENLRWTCKPCNSAKYNKMPEEWAARNGRLFC